MDIFDKYIRATEKERKVEHMDISRLRKTNSIDKLNKEVEKFAVTRQVDERFWKPEKDKTGNGAFIIRFLPEPAVDGDEAVPFVRLYTHAFKGPTQQWYIENSLTSLKQKDPCGEYNSKLWAAGEYSKDSPERKQASEQKRKEKYISNIMVISDPKNPENEGKVFLFSYGKKIFDKIKACWNPEFEGDVEKDPFDLWNGMNFRLRIKNVRGSDGKTYPSYEESSFENSSAVYPDKTEDDPAYDTLWKSLHSLQEFVDPKNFKSYSELKTRLDQVLGFDTASYGSTVGVTANPSPTTLAQRRKPAPVVEEEEIVESFEDDDDEDLKRFRNLAN